MTIDKEMQAAVHQWVSVLTGRKDWPGVLVECRRQGWGALQADKAICGKPPCLGGKSYSSGLGTHADGEIVVHSGKAMSRVRAVVGIDDNADTRVQATAIRLVFSVESEGRTIWKSPACRVGDAGVPVDVCLPHGTQSVILRTRSVTGSIHYAHADWADAAVEIGGREIRLGNAAMLSLPVPDPAPFSFRYGGRSSVELLPQWKHTVSSCKAGNGRILHQTTWRDPKTGIDCRMDMTEFKDFPAVEWVLHFRNTGRRDTPAIEDVQALDMVWPAAGDTSLYRSRGSPCTISDFELMREPIGAGATVRMAAGGGRSSNSWLPFFNLESGHKGVITAVGWSGQWGAEFARQGDGPVRMRAGMELMHLKLRPGEGIRTPRMLLVFWQKDRQAGHNLLRQLLLDQYVPRLDGKPIPGPFAVAHWGGMKSQHHFERLAMYRFEKLRYDYYWMDAGWYGPADSYSPDEFTGDWWKHVGNWTINPAAHPKGLLPLAKAIEKAGMKFLLWFEPERAISGTPWAAAHPDWFLGERGENKNLLLDLGNPQALKWITDYMVAFIKKNHVGLYRQDFNFNPLPYWRAADTKDRQGVTEIRHIEGLYKFWDALRQRCPGLIIDNCSSGGRRIDLETVSRSIPLWRSDWQCWPTNDPIGGQVHGMGLSYWVPLHGTGVWSSMPASAGDVYRVRSSFGAALMFAVAPYEHTPVKPDYPWEWHRKMMADYRRAQPFFRGDYYPLTGCTTAADQWAAYQMHRPDMGKGLVMVFRRHQSPYRSAQLRLHGLDPRRTYTLENADTGKRQRLSGRRLMENGLPVDIGEPHRSRLFFYG